MNESFDFEIYEPPKGRRYWVVKADAGRYYSTFIENSVISIGHLNDFVNEPTALNPFNSTSRELKDRMTVKRKGKDYFNPNNYGQVNSFVNEMNVGDWVITKTSEFICIGQIRSQARLETSVIKHIINKGEPYERQISMDFMLRRDVCWGPTVKMSHLPTDIFISLRSPMTLYNIDKHMESIYYTLYPFYKIDNSLRFSIRINKESEIHNLYLVKLFEYLNELEFLSHADIQEGDLEEIYIKFVESGLFNLSTQASFHSPGDVWAKVFLENKQMFKAVLIYSMLFGNSVLGFDGVFDLESRQNIIGALIERVDMNAIQETVKELNLSMPNYDTEEIETDFESSSILTKV